ncbi:DUF559 domain-containing protein, partial [Candidatus Parabeggiatoa sp. HSG14]|uniref:DUF559 domain-containing protein n=1 Tax=Candidatus Parabeggiatoa sp. HSG14 TaxID=3055593 RepID=UPI0025A77F17|nr:DUF559 domain-containing protein [Thiotrichales bacterium HSG14]
TAVISGRGTAELLNLDHKALQRMGTNKLPKTLEPFIDKGWSMGTNSVEVVSKDSPYRGRKITVYTAKTIETLISAYALALANRKLRENQCHIGERCVVLLKSLLGSALETAIKQACGLPANIQDTAQKHYKDVIGLIKNAGFRCSIDDNIAIKKDITRFLKIPESTLNGFLRKHQDEIEPIKLDYATIRGAGFKASRMNGYYLEDVGKIALGMDSMVGIELKKQVFGSVSSLAKLETKGEIEWQKVLAKVFAGFNFHHNYFIGQYKVDFFVEELMLVLECNGYDNHIHYNQEEEIKREQFINQRYGIIRFHHQTDWESLVNGILHAKAGTVVRLYNVDHIYPDNSQSATLASL